MLSRFIIRQILKAGAWEVEDYLDAAMKRKRELYPEWDIYYCAAKKSKNYGLEELIRSAWEFDQRLKDKFES